MNDTHHQQPTAAQLLAFVDGELPMDQHLAVMTYLAEHPEAMRQAINQQRMRQAVARSIQAATPTAPAALRDRIATMTEQTVATTPPAPARPAVLARIGPIALLALAAMMLLAASVLFLTSPAPDHRPGMIADARFANLPLNALVRRHLACSTKLDLLHAIDQSPRDVKQLPGYLKDYLGQARGPNLDLSAMGYEFKGMGDCAAPGDGAVHLIYYSKQSTGLHDAISLWLRPAKLAHMDLAPGRLYKVTTDQAPMPLLIWRQGDMVYYLMGNSPQQVRLAADHLLKNKV